MYDVIIQQLETYQNQWYVWDFIGIALSLATWLVLTARLQAHARTLVAKLSFLLSPRLPRTMLIIDRRVYYDGEYEVVKGEDGYYIRTKDGGHYVSEFDPEQTAKVVNAWGARGPEDVDSPYSLAWRWLVASMIIVYLCSMGMIAAYNDPRISVLKWLDVFSVDVPRELIINILSERAMNTAIATVAFAVGFAWWLANLLRLSARGVKRAVFVSIASSAPTVKIIPAVSPDSPVSPLAILRKQLMLNLTDEAKRLLEQLAKKAQTDLATLIEVLNEASLARYWRQSTGKLLSSIDDYKMAAEAEATLKMQAVTPRVVKSMTKIVILVAVAALAIGFMVGWGFGSTWGVQVVHNTTVATAASYGYGYGSEAPVSGGGNVTVTPAPLPPPPIGGGSSG